MEACVTNALPYRTVERWVKAFRSGRNETADLQRTGRPSNPKEQIDTLSSLLTIHRRWTVRELSLEVSHQAVWRIMTSTFFAKHLHIVLHDNARCHVANNVTLLLRRWQWEILERPPYSPDMSPCDFDLFPKLKEPLRGHRFHDVSSVLHAVGRSVAHISNQHLATGLQCLPDFWQKVISIAGDYIEGM